MISLILAWVLLIILVGLSAIELFGIVCIWLGGFFQYTWQGHASMGGVIALLGFLYYLTGGICQ